MTGLLLVAVLLIWLGACVWLVGRVGKRLPDRPWRSTVKFVLFVVMLPLPLIDEIIAKPQFEALCKEKAVVSIVAPNLQGKTLWYAGVSRTINTIGKSRIVESKWSFVVAPTGEPAYHYSSFDAEGGWFVRMLGISETTAPLVFPSHCQPEKLSTIRQELQVQVIDRPIERK